jgi:hypothetical protein
MLFVPPHPSPVACNLARMSDVAAWPDLQNLIADDAEVHADGFHVCYIIITNHSALE